MIAFDSSTVVAFLEGEKSPDTHAFAHAVENRFAVFPPVVLTELFSSQSLTGEMRAMLLDIPLLESKPGFWQRAGELRKKARATGRRARLGDSLIAQACLDAGVGLITRDKDFHTFTLAAGLNLSP